MEPTAIVILGASGDLARRKLIPALSQLYGKKQFCGECVIIGSGRTHFSDEEFRARFAVSPEFSHRLFYQAGIPGLKRFIESKGTFSGVVFFLALPPLAYGSTAQELSQEGFGKEARIIIEKPFGYNYESACRLNETLHQFFKESQIFRIDHYLAKEAVQNILVFRFANALFYPVWNSRYVESIQINAFEDIGVESRGAYFDTSGIVRDMIQNHLFQLLCLLTMEAPVSLAAEDIAVQKISILKSLEVNAISRGQYQGYVQEKNVAPDSKTETYAEVKAHINNFRWTGTPIYMRTGKALNRKGTEIGVRFKPLPRLLFNERGDIRPNQIVFKIQPAEGIVIDVSNKIPSGELQVTSTTMAFCYREAFPQEIPEAYRKLLLDAINGDHTLFVTAEETELSWQKLDQYLDKGELTYYERGTVPQPKLFDSWIDFDAYTNICA
jgi:glucose-6-phosphate 1-dehydrogenase